MKNYVHLIFLVLPSISIIFISKSFEIKMSLSLNKKQSIGLLVLSSICFAVSFISSFVFLGFMALIPYFLVLFSIKRKKEALVYGSIFGGLSGIILFSWAPQALNDFLGGNFSIAVVLFLLGIILYIFMYAIVALCLSFIIISKLPLWSKILGIAVIWALFDNLYAYLFAGAPWIVAPLSRTVASAAFLIQLAAWAGESSISFFVLIINIALAAVLFFYKDKGKKNTALSIGIIGIVLFLGLNFLSLSTFEKWKKGNDISFGIINENTASNLKWDEKNGDALVQNLLQLNQQAAALHPDIILWSESSVPWTFLPDDPFVLEIQKVNIPHILGISSPYQNEMVYNSAYFLSPDKPFERYDKRYLLSFAEQVPLPVFESLLGPGFLIEAGTEASIFHTQKGNIGIVICNESFVAMASQSSVAKGASAMTLMANDGWVSNSPYLARQHWLSTKLRAVENRRDFVVNCNLGYSGSIGANGKEKTKWKGTNSVVKKVSTSQYFDLSIYNRFPYLINYLYICLIIFLTIFLFAKNKH